MFMGGCETSTPAPPQDTQERRVGVNVPVFPGT